MEIRRQPEDAFARMTPEQRQAYETLIALVQSLEAVLNEPIVHKESIDILAAEMADRMRRIREIQFKIQEHVSHHDFLSYNDSETNAYLVEAEYLAQPRYSKSDPEFLLLTLLDTETTGLSDQDEPISVGAILVEVEPSTGNVIREIDTYYGLREPAVPIHPEAQKVHGMVFEDLCGKDFNYPRIGKLVRSADLLVAHNAKFDRRMLSKIVPLVMDVKWADTMYGLRQEWSRISNGRYSLDAICEALHVERPAIHNALADCRALLNVLMSRSGKTERSSRLMANLVAAPWAPPP